MALHGILHNEIDAMWPLVAPLVLKALARGQGDYEIADVYSALKAKEMQLWVWVGNDRVTAVLVTCIIIYPRHKVLQLVLCGGDGLEQWRDEHTKTIEAFAREVGCDCMEIFGREGWGRTLEGWEKIHTHFRRAL